jgi:conjugal transfer pilus assembly protein TraB
MIKLKTLKDISASKKIILYLLAGGIVLFIVVRSMVNTYNEMTEQKKLERNIVPEKVVDIKDRAVFDIDQTTAIKNQIQEVKKELENKLNESNNQNAELNKQIEENQKILQEQQAELIALKSLNDKEDKIANKKVSEEIDTIKDNLIETKKELERLRKEKMVSDKLGSSNIDLPELKGPLAEVINEENKELNKLPMAEIKPEINQIPTKAAPEKGFFKFAGKEIKEDEDKGDEKSSEKKEAPRKMDLMMGLVDAIMVTGVDAPTNIGTKNSDAKDPLPVLLSVNSETIIANSYVQEYKDCFILGTATGNATTERAYIRLSKMSCVAKNGATRIETEIEGWVYGEDNKVGVSGHLVTKSGTLILKGLMAGVLQGIADSVSNTDNYFENGNGYSNRNNNGLGQGAADGFGSGVGSAFKTLADFYIDMAKDLYPVIEVKGGREVQLLVKGGKEITEVPYNKLFVNSDYEIDLNKNITIEY